MASLSVSTLVAAPLDHVFAVFTDLEKTAERVPGITSLEVLSEGPFGEGTRWRETRLMFKKEAQEEMWVTGFDPPHSYNVEAESHGAKYSTHISFIPEAAGTQVTWAFTSTPQTFGAKLMGPVFNTLLKGTMKKCMLGDLEALKDVAEREQS